MTEQMNTPRNRFDITDLVFQQDCPTKKFILPERLFQRFKKLLIKTGLDTDLNIHSIRHSVATRLLNLGASIRTVQAIGGWSSPDVLLKVYAHTSPEEVRKATELLSVN